MSLAAPAIDPSALLVERAFAGARIACGAVEAPTPSAYPRQVRVLAGAALFRANLMTAKAACRDCVVGASSALSPSQIEKANVTDEMIRVVVAYLKEGVAPPSPAPASHAGPTSGAKRNPAPVHANASKNTKLRRFGAADVEPERVVDLPARHAAIVEGRTLFPGSVTPSQKSARLLVSGQNNTKLGGEVLKGERTGWPIFQLTLEERATCPRDCAVWAGCYGNAMPFARRHRNDADLMRLIRSEVAAAARMYPGGFLVRVHTLGDFFSVEYVLMWAELIATTPQLHVFGYTARREDSDDPDTRKIARAIRLLTDGMWGRFAIRTSHAEFGPQRSVVVMKDPELPDVIVCPAQKVKTEACSTCGLCWSPTARDKTIAFLKHGMKRGRRAPEPVNEALNPAGETIPSSQGVRGVAEAVTGDSPVASAIQPILPAAPAAVPAQPAPPSKLKRMFLPALVPDTRPPNPVTARKLRFIRRFLAADWRLAEVAHLFDVEPADIREALGAAA